VVRSISVRQYTPDNERDVSFVRFFAKLAFYGSRDENETRPAGRFRMSRDSVASIRRTAILIVTAILLQPTLTRAQSPWERAASNLELTFTGPLARSLALVAIVIGGLLFMFGEGGAKRQISGIVFGGGLALFAGQFLAWLF
jgi:type IV secretory pathway VirB2 component (pilin)